jgi:hypothetical protein
MFLDGATENIDHELALDQQADFLPYNPNYEYSRENLKLGNNSVNTCKYSSNVTFFKFRETIRKWGLWSSGARRGNGAPLWGQCRF